MESGCLQKEIGKVTHIKCLTSPPRFSPQETFGGDFGTVICLHDKPNKMMIDGNFKITTDQLTLTFTEGQRQDFFIRHTPAWKSSILRKRISNTCNLGFSRSSRRHCASKPRPYYCHGLRNWLPVTDSITPGSASIRPVHVGEAAPTKDISTCRYI